MATLQVLSSHRATLDSLMAEHRGRIANTAGDSVLAEFPSAVDAVSACPPFTHCDANFLDAGFEVFDE